MRNAHEELMKQVRSKAIHISNKYKGQSEPFYFEWEMLKHTIEKELLDILSKMLSHNSQQEQQPLKSDENRYIPSWDRDQYNKFRRGSYIYSSYKRVTYI